jgi:hypothetical protein
MPFPPSNAGNEGVLPEHPVNTRRGRSPYGIPGTNGEEGVVPGLDGTPALQYTVTTPTMLQQRLQVLPVPMVSARKGKGETDRNVQRTNSIELG